MSIRYLVTTFLTERKNTFTKDNPIHTPFEDTKTFRYYDEAKAYIKMAEDREEKTKELKEAYPGYMFRHTITKIEKEIVFSSTILF